MPDWTKSMEQTYEYYEVDPATWTDRKQITNVISSSVKRDLSNDTGGSASFKVDSDLGELYVRTYLVTTQYRITERHPLGTHLCQTTGEGFDGKTKSITLDAYTPLLELKDNRPPIGYSLASGINILNVATSIVSENCRAPVIGGSSDKTLPTPFVSELNDTWFSFLSDLLACAGYFLDCDEMGRVLFVPYQDSNSLQPVWKFDDNNSSILQPDFDIDRDLYGIPNVVEVVYTKDTQGTNDTNNRFIYSRAVNDDPNSPSSTVNRGREIVQRINNPEIYGEPDQIQLDNYARQALRDLSSLEYTVTYTHAYCPVRLNDCVLLNYRRAGLVNIKAKVIRQSISCDSGGQVEETAIYTTNLWG